MATSLYEDLCALAPRANKTLLKQLAKAAPGILPEYGINTALREAHFWAQAAHETAGFRYMNEVWGPTPAQQRYEGRKDLGNSKPGDGRRYAGRGIFQLTGRANYRKYGDILGLELENYPDRATEPEIALRIACEYWKARNINPCADADDIVAITKKINGGTNGIADRRTCLAVAKKMWADNDLYTADDSNPPAPPVKTMSDSKQGMGAVAIGALGSVGAAQQVVDQVNQANGLMQTLMDLAQKPSFVIMVAIVAVGGAIWYWRKKHLEEYGV
jgi:putative chitinase